MTETRAVRKCFISAGYGAQLKELQGVLDHLNVVWEWARSAPSEPSILNSVVSAIRGADFIIGVLQEGQLMGNVLVELGIAVGLGKPMLLLKTGDAELPSELNQSAVFDTDLMDRKLLEFHIDLFLRSMDGRSKPKRSTKTLPTNKRPSKNTPAPDLFGSALEQSVAAAITTHGGRVTIPSKSGQERTPDLLMWMPQLDSELFNPAAIEAVSSKSSANLEKLQLQFASFLQSSGLRCGLIVVNSIAREKELRKLPPIPWIFWLTLHEFKARLASGDLGRWAKNERNRLAHGVR